MERGKRKPALDLDYAGAEKKSRDEAQPTNGPPGHDTIQDTTLRPQDITFRPHHPPHHRSSQIEINLGHKVAFTRAEVEAILRRLSQLHRQELDEQYQTFQAVVTDCLRARTQTRWDCAYIS